MLKGDNGVFAHSKTFLPTLVLANCNRCFLIWTPEYDGELNFCIGFRGLSSSRATKLFNFNIIISASKISSCASKLYFPVTHFALAFFSLHWINKGSGCLVIGRFSHSRWCWLLLHERTHSCAIIWNALKVTDMYNLGNTQKSYRLCAMMIFTYLWIPEALPGQQLCIKIMWLLSNIRVTITQRFLSVMVNCFLLCHRSMRWLKTFWIDLLTTELSTFIFKSDVIRVCMCVYVSICMNDIYECHDKD